MSSDTFLTKKTKGDKEGLELDSDFDGDNCHLVYRLLKAFVAIAKTRRQVAEQTADDSNWERAASVLLSFLSRDLWHPLSMGAEAIIELLAIVCTSSQFWKDYWKRNLKAEHWNIKLLCVRHLQNRLYVRHNS